jgi:hypothetical protein
VTASAADENFNSRPIARQAQGRAGRLRATRSRFGGGTNGSDGKDLSMCGWALHCDIEMSNCWLVHS